MGLCESRIDRRRAKEKWNSFSLSPVIVAELSALK
jgi:hypothetical protein